LAGLDQTAQELACRGKDSSPISSRNTVPAGGRSRGVPAWLAWPGGRRPSRSRNISAVEPRLSGQGGAVERQKTTLRASPRRDCTASARISLPVAGLAYDEYVYAALGDVLGQGYESSRIAWSTRIMVRGPAPAEPFPAHALARPFEQLGSAANRPIG